MLIEIDDNDGQNYVMSANSHPTDADMIEIQHNLRCGYLSGRTESRLEWSATPLPWELAGQ